MKKKIDRFQPAFNLPIVLFNDHTYIHIDLKVKLVLTLNVRIRIINFCF